MDIYYYNYVGDIIKMNNKETKNQHFVPETYLESFTDDGKCCVYNKKNGKQFSTTPRNILSRRYLYDFDFSKYKDILEKI